MTDWELLAVRFFMEYYKHYLLGRQFVARTDHQALKWLYSLREPKDRIARWLETLSAYQFSIEYQPGHKHGNADAMSRRCPNPQECKMSAPGRGGPEVWAMPEVSPKRRDYGQCTHGLPREPEKHAGPMQ